MGALWTTDPKSIRAFHAWLHGACERRCVNLTYETAKRRALGVEHLAQYAGSYGQAQQAILRLMDAILKDAGNPEQLTLLSPDA